MNIILCGLPTSGKTIVGTLVATALKRPFVDTDGLIEAFYASQTGRVLRCCQIHGEVGEKAFRDLERQQVATLQGRDHTVIALGGGSLGDSSTRELLRSMGQLIYLKAPVDVLWERIQRRGMLSFLDPLDPKTSFLNIAQQRASLYEGTAHVTIDTHHRSPEEIAAEIIKR